VIRNSVNRNDTVHAAFDIQFSCTVLFKTMKHRKVTRECLNAATCVLHLEMRRRDVTCDSSIRYRSPRSPANSKTPDADGHLLRK